MNKDFHINDRTWEEKNVEKFSTSDLNHTPLVYQNIVS